jgi:hypothetical protein
VKSVFLRGVKRLWVNDIIIDIMRVLEFVRVWGAMDDKVYPGLLEIIVQCPIEAWMSDLTRNEHNSAAGRPKKC